MKTELVLVTPDMAKKLLEKNTKNRPVKEKNVAYISNQMSRGEWVQTGDTNVKISKTNVLLDGQHTLLGIIRSGKTIELFIACDLDDKAFDYIDTGSARSATDVVGVNGFKHPAILSAAARIAILFQKGIYNKEKKGNNITNHDVLNFVQANEPISDSAQYAYTICKKNKLLASSTVAALHFLFSKKDADKADDFFDKFSTGTDLQKGNPILTLRERLMLDIQNKTKLKIQEKMAFTISSWNAYVKGKELKQLRSTDEFPVII